MKYRILVIFEEIPDDIRLVILDVDKEEEVNLLRGFHNKYINSVGTEEHTQGLIAKFFYHDDHGYFKYPEIPGGNPIENETFHLVIRTGMIC